MRDYYVEGCDYDEEWSDLREGRRHLAEYPGFLGEQICLDPQWLTANPQEMAELQKQADRLVHHKVCGFFAFFGIDPRKPDAWEKLAHALLLQLPGFRITLEPPASPRAKKRRGARKKYKENECTSMVMIVGKAMKEIVAEGGRPSILEALRRELEKGDLEGLALKADRKTKMDAESLESRYDELKKIWINLPTNKGLLKDPRNTPETLARDYLKFSASLMLGSYKP